MTSTTCRSTLRAAGYARPLALRARLRLQSLEERAVPATYTVNTTTDTASGTGTSGSLRYVIGLANGNAGADSIVFDPSVFASAATITLNSTLGQLAVTDSLNITGPGSNIVTVSGGGSVRVFDVDGTSSSAGLGLKYITVSGGQVSSVGGAGIRIHSGASASLTQSTVSSNVATSSDGGGVQVVGSGALYIDASTFVGNAAADGYGGAVDFSSSGTLQVYNSGFDNNAADFGGGVAIRDSGNVILSNDTFTLNDAGTDGGGVFAEGTSTDLQSVRVIECEFGEILDDGGKDKVVNGNTALNGNGGGFYGRYFIDDGFSDCFFGANRAIINLPDFSGGGGGIFVANSDLTVSNSTITENIADLSGGGVYGKNSTLTLVDCQVTGNIYAAAGPPVYGTRYGGGIAALFSTTTLTRCLISGNTSEAATLGAPDNGNGGGVFSQFGDLSLTDCTLTLNRAGGTGVDGFGGAVFFDGPSSAVFTLRIDTCVIGESGKGNFAERSGGGVYAVGGVVEIEDTRVEYNSSNGVGGGVSLVDLREATVSGDTIAFNVAKGAGGGLYISGATFVPPYYVQPLLIQNCTISSNAAGGLGGGVRAVVTLGPLTIDRTTIDANLTSSDGAGLSYFADKGSAPLAIKDSTLSRDVTTTGNGGGLHLSGGGSPRVQNSTIALNEAVWGGGVYFAGSDQDDEPEFYNTTIAGNVATGDDDVSKDAQGGGIFLHDFTGGGDLLRLDSVILAKNDATSGSPAVTTGPDLFGDDTGTLADVLELDSIIGVADSAGFTFATGSTGNQNGTLSSPFDPGLDVVGGAVNLTNNGGPTETIALVSTSKAINEGSNPLGLTYDQRGPGSFTPNYRTVGPRTDCGAYEYLYFPEEDGFAAMSGSGGTMQVVPPATVTGIVVNETYSGPGGAEQRNTVIDVTVYFSAGIELPRWGNTQSVFCITRQSDGAKPSLIATDVSTGGDNSVVRLTFIGTTALEGNSLADGRYTLTVFASQVSGGYFDGDGDGRVQDDYILVGSASGPGLFRLLGDYTGDGAVDALDFAVFRTIYAPGHDDDSAYDFGGDGWIGSEEYAAFAGRHGSSI